MSPSPMRSVAVLVACLTGVVTFVLAMVTLRHGVMFGPDSWTYWTSSIALLEGRGFVDGHGLPVIDWPPGYPLWLALVQGIVGVSVDAVRLADALLIGVTAAGIVMWGGMRAACTTSARWWTALASCVACLAMARGAGSEMPMLAALAWSLVAYERWASAASGRVVALIVVSGCCAGMILTRHAALGFVPGYCGMLLGAGKRTVRARLLAATVLGSAAVITWLVTRALLEQGGALQWFVHRHGVFDVLSAIFRGLDRGIAPFPIGGVLFVLAMLAFGPLRVRAAAVLRVPVALVDHRAAVRFVAAGLLMLVAMYVVVYVADPPNARFVRFASIPIAVLAVAVAHRSPVRWLRVTLLLLLLVPNAVRSGKYVVRGRTFATTVNEHGGGSFLPLHAVPGPRDEPESQLLDGHLQVPVPLFVWQRERLDARGGG